MARHAVPGSRRPHRRRRHRPDLSAQGGAGPPQSEGRIVVLVPGRLGPRPPAPPSSSRAWPRCAIAISSPRAGATCRRRPIDSPRRSPASRTSCCGGWTGTGPACGSRSRRSACAGGTTATSRWRPRVWTAPGGTDRPAVRPAADRARCRLVDRDGPTDWRDGRQGAIERLGLPVLTTVDADGWPLPLRTVAAEPTADGFDVVVPAGVEIVDGPAFLSFHTHDEVFDGQENIGLAGHAHVDRGRRARDRRSGTRRLGRLEECGPLGHRHVARRACAAAPADDRSRPPRRQPARRSTTSASSGRPLTAGAKDPQRSS